MTLLEIFLIAIALCFDTLAVTMGSSVTLRRAPLRETLAIAFVFGAVQTLFLVAGWACGAGVLSFIYQIANWIGFGLLLYIGGSMFWHALKEIRKGEANDEKPVSLNGFRAIVLAGVATSIDALAVGISYALTSISIRNLLASLAATFAVTFAFAVAGILGGSRIGERFGSHAELVGGLVLIGIGIHVVCG